MEMNNSLSAFNLFKFKHKSIRFWHIYAIAYSEASWLYYFYSERKKNRKIPVSKWKWLRTVEFIDFLLCSSKVCLRLNVRPDLGEGGGWSIQTE